MKTINLGRENDEPCCAAVPQGVEKNKGPIYPTVYINGVEGLEGAKVDQEVTLKGVIKQVSERKDGDKMKYSCDIDVKELTTGGSAPSMKKSKAQDDKDAIDEGLDEEMGEEEETEE